MRIEGDIRTPTCGSTLIQATRNLAEAQGAPAALREQIV